jgi:cytochrome c oxidase cbb3-type subunit 3
VANAAPQHPKHRAAFSVHAGRRWWLAGLALVVLGLFGAWTARALGQEAMLVGSDPDAIPLEPALLSFAAARGAPLFREHCAACHGPGGKGDPARGAPNLTDSDWLYGEGKVSDIEKVVRHGIRAHDPRTWSLAVMPAYGSAVPSPTERVPPLSPGEIRSVTEYLLSLEGRPADPHAATVGDALFHDKAGCYDCHTNDAKGDPAIGAPNLTDNVWLYGDGSHASIIRSITYGRQGMCPAWSRRLSLLQTREVSLYVFNLSHHQAPTPTRAR